MRFTSNSTLPRIIFACILLLTVMQCSSKLPTQTPIPAVTSGTGPTSPLKSDTATRPKNLLLIMVDDLGFNDLAINNQNTQIHTPNMDAIARQGMRFTRHYAAESCSPARAALLSGLHPERLGYLPNGPGISTDVITMPEHLQSMGYATQHIGKWHLGDKQRSAWPDRQGFDHWFGFLNQWRLAGKQSEGEIVLSTPRYLDPYLEGDQDKGQFYRGHLNDILTERTIAALTALNKADQPWFVNLWYYAPHPPIQPSDTFSSQYPDTPAGHYRALVHQLDHNIGRINGHLQTLGLEEDTILVVISDNGGTNRQIDNNTPYHGQKAYITEGGLRTPLIIRWVDPTLNKRVVKDIISIEDVYPTLMEAMGSKIAARIDGVSFMPAFKGKAPYPQRNLFWLHGADAASYGALSADGNWRLYQPLPFYGAYIPQKMYNLKTDPSSRTAVDAPAENRKLLQAFARWFEDVLTVPTRSARREDGTLELRGRDLQRTPGQGGFTFGIGVAQDYEGVIASQHAIWSLSKDENSVWADFGVARVSGELTLDRPCHSLVVVGNFARRSAGFGPASSVTLSLYLDGEEVDGTELHGELNGATPESPTIIGAVQPGEASQPGIPTIMNAVLDSATPLTIEQFSARFCSTHFTP